MSDGLLDLIEPRLPVEKGSKTQASPSNYKWVKIYDMRDEVNGNWTVPTQSPISNPNAIPDLEVWGAKLNWKLDKKIDKTFSVKYAAELICKFARYFVNFNKNLFVDFV